MIFFARRRPLFSRLVGVCLLAALGLAAPQAQTPGSAIPDPGALPGTSAVPRAALPPARALPAEALVLEGPVDPANYLVGPGDVFMVSIGGSLGRQVPVTVSADGTLVVPEAGSFNVAGRSLTAVKSTVGAALQRRFANVVTDIALAQPRQFFVHVSGAVPLPGRYAVRATARVEDAVALASGQPSARRLADYGRPEAVRSQMSAEARPALRNVAVRHADGRTARVDLMRYFVTGDVAHNPVLRDGDALVVSTFDPVAEGVVVSGAVPRPGLYDLHPGDTALDLLVIAAGDDAARRLGGVRLIRAGQPAQTFTIAQAAALTVAPRDQVFAVEAEPEAGLVEIVGAVAYPGLYPIRNGQTTLAELIAMAGGLEPDALGRGAYLERRMRDLPVDVQGEAPRLVDLDLFGRGFLMSEIYRTPRVAVDLARTTSGAQPVSLRDGDRLVVPRDVGGVRVFGQVQQAGYVPFVPGRRAEEYVAAAGGLGPGAERTYVLEAGTGRLVPAPDAPPVQPGDAVFVDRVPMAENQELALLALQERAEQRAARNEERQDRMETRQARFQVLQTAIGAIGTVVSLVVAVVALRQ